MQIYVCINIFMHGSILDMWPAFERSDIEAAACACTYRSCMRIYDRNGSIRMYIRQHECAFTLIYVLEQDISRHEAGT